MESERDLMEAIAYAKTKEEKRRSAKSSTRSRHCAAISKAPCVDGIPITLRVINALLSSIGANS